jgi:hypothetical protein
MAADLRQLANVARRAWSYAEDKKQHFGVDLDRILQDKLNRVPAIQSDEDFHQLLREFIAEMKEGHADLSIPGASPTPYAWPFTIRQTAQGYIIDRVLRDLDGPQVGDRLLKVNGASMTLLHQRQMKIQPASSDGMRAFYGLRQLRFTRARVLAVEYQDAAGQLIRRELRTLPRWQDPFAGQRQVTWQSLAGNIGYVRVPSFGGNAALFEQAMQAGKTPLEASLLAIQTSKVRIRQAFADLAATRALILDLRGNGGGFDRLGMFLSQFLSRPLSHRRSC